ncbi:hypothetical protein [Flavobacterium sp.]|jgi:hypothetical protein|uniref:hypothetical protein n=1 Tax=Flavobacterium sp. TaxID=239 RepID=UPI0037BFEC9B
MKLNAEQIDKIDVILDKLGLDFLDIKLEVKDHIACQVEENMRSGEVTFDASLIEVLKCWESKLVLEESWLISKKKSFPKIVIQRLFKRFLIYNTSVVLFVILSYFFFQNYKQTINDFVLFSKYSTIIYSCFFGIYSILWVKMYFQKIKTSFFYQFKQNFSLLFLFQFYSVLSFSTLMNYFCLSMLLILTPFQLYTFYKHQQFINKYKLV